jgi:hypothetical protein
MIDAIIFQESLSYGNCTAMPSEEANREQKFHRQYVIYGLIHLELGSQTISKREG